MGSSLAPLGQGLMDLSYEIARGTYRKALFRVAWRGLERVT